MLQFWVQCDGYNTDNNGEIRHTLTTRPPKLDVLNASINPFVVNRGILTPLVVESKPARKSATKGVRRPRGRPLAVTRQLRSLAAPPEPLEAGHVAATPLEGRHERVALRSRPPEATARCAAATPASEPETSVLSSASAERAIMSIFAHVSRAAVACSSGSPHLNVGEVLPPGVTTLLRELGGITAHDVFFDFGSGLGNVVVQVALATKVSKAIGIDIRDDVQDLGVDMIARSPYGERLREQTKFMRSDITGLRFSRIDPYAQATIIFWNNILFEAVTVEFVKRELSELAKVRLVVCTAPICPRHREPCFAEFCSSFELFKEADVICSWKFVLHRAYFYRSFQA
ncbi:unnamed protein product [Phytophthora fragariaefolia]|uniref:Histone-lysine N-methyltransferase, H3 lysine-79 specific n=1 Tax=Phytophthora fragariaefolia TaxID=1490495 RepID=A0A9W6U7E5_9STRA|nr:unnamed protein product [Phytophthora fragariaefolia]